MSKSLADLRATKRPRPRRPEFSLTLTLAPDLMAESQALQAEYEAIVARSGEQPKRAGQGEPPRLAEIRDRLVTVYAEMAEFDGELRCRANLSDGDWRRWCNEHPAREEGDPGYDRDQRVTYGYCNADDLLDNLGEFTHAWNGELCGPGEWAELIEPDTYPGDKNDMARKIVEMYEANSSDFRQRRDVLLGSLKRLNGSVSPGSSESVTNGSMAGSPDGSSVVTTVTESE